MKEFQTVVQELLHNHERQRRYIALLTALCMVMAFTVSVILIEPAESMTGQLVCGMTEHIHSEDCFTYTCGLENDTDHVHSAECRKLTCGQTEHVHSENCYLHEDEQAAELMQINAPQMIENDMPEGDSPEGDEGISPQADTARDEWLNDNESFNKALEAAPEGAHPITEGEITQLEVKESEEGDSLSKGEDDKYHIQAKEDSKEIYFVLHYTINKDVIKEGGNQYIYIEIPDGFDIPQDWYTMDSVVIDSTYEKNENKAGYFSINQKTRMLVIRFTDEYVKAKLEGTEGTFSGTVTFEGKFNRDDTSKGDKEFDLWNNKIVIDFPEKTYYAEKEGKIKPADTTEGKPKVEWTITVNNYYPTDATNTLTGYTVRDGRFPKGGEGVTVTPDNLGKWVTEGDSTYYKFNDGVKTDKVTFTFTEVLKDEEVTAQIVSNTVDLQKDGSSVSTKHVDVTFDDKPILEKKGAAKYPVDGEDYIEWTINVTNPLGGSLKDYYLIDEAFKGKTAEDITISPKEATFDLNDNKLTFTSDVTDVTITYRQLPTPEVGYYSNDVDLYKDNNNKVGHNSANLNYSERYKLDKSGEYNADTKEITWTVKASTTDTNDTNVTLNGYKLQDDALKGKKIEDIVFKNLKWTWEDFSVLSTDSTNNKVIIGKDSSNYVEIALNPETGEITIKDIGDKSLHSLEFSYTTKADEADASGTNGTVKTGDKISNTVTDSKGESASGEVTVESRNLVEKTFLGDTGNNMKADVYDRESRTLKWQVDLTQDDGFGGTTAFVDVMSATGGGNHYLDIDSQKGNIKLRAKVNDSDGWIELQATDYEIKFYNDSSSSTEITNGHANKFVIEFKDNLKDNAGNNYHYVEITYETTADIQGISPKQTAKFTNEASYNGKTDGPDTSYDITYYDSVQKFKLNVIKDWQDNENAAGIRPDSVKFYLERRFGVGGKWEKIYQNGGEWEEVPENTPEDNYTFTIGKDSWQLLLENLPIDKSNNHNEKYYYRVREVGVDNKIYTVKYSDEQGVSGTVNDTIKTTITNTKEMTFDKVALGADGQPLKDGEKLDLNALGPVEITEEHNGVKTTGNYYVIGYQFTIDAENDYSTKWEQFTDTLPEGFELVFTEESIGNTQVTAENQYYPNNETSWRYCLTYSSDNVTTMENFTYNKTANQVIFTLDSKKSNKVTYYIKAPADDLNNAFTKKFKSAVKITTASVTNTITGPDGTTKSATVDVTGQIKDNPLKNVLKKDVANDYNDKNNKYQSNNGVVSYSVYVNPDGKNLSNSDELDVLDDLVFGDFTGIDPFDKNKLTAELRSVKVERINNFRMENGSPKADYVETLPESDYSYTTEEGIKETWEGDVEYKLKRTPGGNGGYDYKYDSALEGDDITLTIVGTPNHNFGYNGFLVNGINNLDFQNVDIPGNGILSLKATASSTSIQVWFSDDHCKNIESVSMTAHRTVTTDIASRLTVSVPDETPLKITYTYKLMYNNQELSSNVTAQLSNKVSITSGTSTVTDSKDDVEFYVNRVEATVGTDGIPNIVKYNIGNVATNPEATFYLAIYEGSKWKFASTDNSQELKDSSNNVIGQKHIFTYAAEPPTEKPNGIPQSDESGNSGALKLHMEADKPFYLELKSGILYKLIEIKAPDGYEASDDDINTLSGGAYNSLQKLLEGELNSYLNNPTGYSNAKYKNLLNKFIAVHYFKYGSQELTGINDAMPKDSKYQVVGIGGSVEIPNSELIDIGAQKIWDDGSEGKVEVELLWSHKKSSNGIPSDAQTVKKDTFALSDGFSATQTLNGSNGYKCKWENLPNGYDDKPIYYYVRETSYTVGTKTYEFDESTGKYTDSTGKEGGYKPIYTGNGTNKSAKPDSTRSGESTATDNGIIKIHNSKGLQVKKIWKNSDNTTMATADIPEVEIKFNLYGTTSDGVTEWIYQGTLSKDNWTAEIPEDLVDDNAETNPSKTTLSDYVSFEVEELIEGELITKLYQYTISYNYNLSGTTGEITITNKNPNPTKVDVSVEKVWSDGNDKHSGDNIDVTLYRSNIAISDADLASIDVSDLEVVGFTDGQSATATLNAGNGWKHTWTDLPFKGEGVSKYYYYAIETGVPSGYTASYFVNGNKTTITNSIPGSLTIDKQWLSRDGTDITSTIKNEAKFKLYRRANSSVSTGESKTLDNLKIYAFGDSITAGSGVEWNERYSNLLQEKLKANGTNITVDNSSQVGAKIAITDDSESTTIEGFIKNSTLNDDYGVVIVMAGTNNILNTQDTTDTMKNKMEGLLDTIYQKSSNENLVVFVEKIPRIIDIENDYNHPGQRFSDQNLQENQYQGEWNKLVTGYNSLLDKLAEEYQKTHPERKIIVVDTYTAVGENLTPENNLGKIHPDKIGHQAIADLLYDEILKYYGISGSNAPTNVNGLPSDFYKSDGTVNTDLYEPVTDGEFTLPESGSWSKTFTNLDTKKGTDDYVYYIVEETTGNWTAAYSGNGQTISGSAGATITVTNTVDKGSIEVEKVWKNKNGSDYTPSAMDTVEVQLYRSTTKPSAMNIMNEPMALAVDDLPLNFEKTDDKKGILTIDENYITDGNKLKYLIPAGNYNDGGWIKLKVSDSMKAKKISSIEFPSGTTYYACNSKYTYSGSVPQKIVISPPETLEELIKYNENEYENGSGFSGDFKEDVYLIITLADETEGGDAGGGSTTDPTDPPPSETTPTQPQGDSQLELKEEKGTDDNIIKKAVISNTSTLKAGDVITVNLKYNGDISGIKGCFGFSDKSGEWCNTNIWGNEGMIPITDNYNGTATITWTIPENCNVGYIEFQIWWQANSIDSATYTVTPSGTTTDPEEPPTDPDPVNPTDPEDTDTHIPDGAVKVDEYTLSSTYGWKHTFDNLPLTDNDGNPYYYYVKEVNAPEGFEVTYNDGVTPGGTITITNTKQEASTTTMPSTGGAGARKYYMIGGMLMLMSACGWAMHRRNRVMSR